MSARELGPQGEQALEQVLGYLNFSAGAPDAQFLSGLNLLFGHELRQADGESAPPAWRRVVALLREKLATLKTTSATFSDASQAEAVLSLLESNVLPGYLDFHRDLLFHQSEAILFNSFFLGRTCEAILTAGGPWEDADRVTRMAIAHLNDFIGHRPVPALESRKIEPYPHEFIRPIPLFIRGAGVAAGVLEPVVAVALQILKDTPPEILRLAHFDPTLLDELAMDPRAYDFDHPANKRPNYHFGQWDPHLMDIQSRYRRFVVQQVTVEALFKRVGECDLPREEALFEAGAVMAGTIIMAAGVSGRGSDAHDSTVTLSNLLPKIARYRDQFYEHLLARATGARADRLRSEAKERQQPFGGARQALNQELARRRASQLEHVQLAKIFAQMGYFCAAAKQANVVPTASARMQCQIACWMTEGQHAVAAEDLEHAASLLPRIRDMLLRAIECGAIIDPWNILGFDAHYSLFPALENSVHDHRADELCSLMDNVFQLHSQIWSEAAAHDNQALCRQVSREFSDMVTWWHRFATHEVSSVDAVNALDAQRAAERVAAALNLWHKGNAAAGDVAFWAPHAEMFDSPQAYALVIDTLLKKSDYVASMALLVHWVGQAEHVGLESGECSFHEWAEKWMHGLLNATEPIGEQQKQSPDRLVRKFFDYLEANADAYWQVPQFELADGLPPRPDGAGRDRGHDEPEDDDFDDEENEVFDAAYENVVYKDSTDDGVDGAVFDTSDATHDELTREYRRLTSRLSFHGCLANLWRMAALSPVFVHPDADAAPAEATRDEHAALLRRWGEQAAESYDELIELLEVVRGYRIPISSYSHESLVEYDQKRLTKEAILENVIATAVEMADAKRLLSSSGSVGELELDDVEDEPDEPRSATDFSREQQLATIVRRSLLDNDMTRFRRSWPSLLEAFGEQPLLYVALAKGGKPLDMIAARVRQRTIQDLLCSLPRLGLIHETCELLDVARQMERDHPVGPGAVTEFDELFRIGVKSIVEALVVSAANWKQAKRKAGQSQELAAKLVECLEKVTEALLLIWLSHSRTLRLSVVEKVHDKNSWKQLQSFVQNFGEDIFTQRFLNIGNIRSILHHGAERWLKEMAESDDEEADFKLVREIDKEIPLARAAEHLSLILETVYENYGEYRDYNSTTTQSDRGEMLYTLIDFLRLRSKYDRIAWNLKPVIWVHEVLVRRGNEEAARSWRRALSERINHEADQYLTRLADLQKKYAMRMPTIADRLSERFVRPMSIDRIRALVAPAIHNFGTEVGDAAFDVLEHETDSLTRQPSGAGLDIPAWLVALEEEVDRVRQSTPENPEHADIQRLIPQKPLSFREIVDQMNSWKRPQSDM